MPDDDGVVPLLGRIKQNISPYNALDENGDTALLVAAQGRHLDVVQLLAESGADVDIRNNDAWTAVQWASSNEDKAMIAILLFHGAIVNF